MISLDFMLALTMYLLIIGLLASPLLSLQHKKPDNLNLTQLKETRLTDIRYSFGLRTEKNELPKTLLNQSLLPKNKIIFSRWQK